MHRQEQLKKLVKDWLELELDETCSSMDTFVSINIKLVSKTIVLNKKLRGNTTEIGRIYLEDDQQVKGMVIEGDGPVMGLILFGLEKAVEQN